MNRYCWRPAFTVQVGQIAETPEDNWETGGLINWLSNSRLDDGRPFEFTVTPTQNVPLGRIKSKSVSPTLLDPSQLAVYYASSPREDRDEGRRDREQTWEIWTCVDIQRPR
jgi:hypothetical protein